MSYDNIEDQIAALKEKHHLTDFTFDAECIYNPGDLSNLLSTILNKTLPDLGIVVSENVSTDRAHYVATLSNQIASLEIQADTHSDWLPDTFFMQLESIPETFGSNKRYYSINPAIGLTGQDAWYFCGTESDLKRAREEGLPLVFPGENPMETEEFKRFM